MDNLLGGVGAWLAKAYFVYGIALLISAWFCVDLALLAVVAWKAARGAGRWRGRLIVEIIFGLINPVFYLAILAPSLPELRGSGEWWRGALGACAWILLSAFWGARIFGAALGTGSGAARIGARLLEGAALACVLAYGVKDLGVFFAEDWSKTPIWTVALHLLRISALYLIPAVLLADYMRGDTAERGFFLLTGRAARLAVAGIAVVALISTALAAQRRSDEAVRKLVKGHRVAIHEATARYGTDPRLVASIVYVTHRNQLSPFRDELERLLISAWAVSIRGEFRMGAPENIEKVGTDDNPNLNRALDISAGLAQIKPRTAQTASVLAAGMRPDDLPRPAFYSYRDVEPVGGGWENWNTRLSVDAPIPVPAARRAVAEALLDDRKNLELCALILALYQNQWEAANREWSLRGRPEILATLYQIGFSRSVPHGAPRSNAFGARVRQVYDEPWMKGLMKEPERKAEAPAFNPAR